MTRVLLSVLAGYFVAAALAIVGTWIATAAFPALPGARPAASFLLLNVTLSFLAAVVGGYVGARLAPAGRLTVAVIALVILYLLAGALLARAHMTPAETPWYPALVSLLSATGLMVGVVVERARSTARTP